MTYSEQTIINEIRWEYGWPTWGIIRIIEKYKTKGKYETLCRLIETRGGLY